MADHTIDLEGARILLVDDTQANLDLLCELLEPQGYRISMAPNGEIALRIASRALPDLILLDVMMPGIDGFEVCRRLKADERTHEIPVIFITSKGPTKSLVKGFEVGGSDYITKPFRDQEVLVRARNALSTKLLFDQNRLHQKKMEDELQTAHDLQMGLMPCARPDLAGIDIAGQCVPANHVGGDYFSYFWLDEGRGILGFGAADVSGKAMDAAVRVMQLSGIFGYEFRPGRPLCEVLGGLHEAMVEHLSPAGFVTGCLGTLDVPNGLLRLANAAHPFPYLYSASSSRLRALEIPSLPLGIQLPPGSPYAPHVEVELRMAPGDVLVLYSDGVTDLQNETGEFYDGQRLEALIRKHGNEGAGGLVDAVLEDQAHFVGGASRVDDVTLLVVRIPAGADLVSASAPRLPEALCRAAGQTLTGEVLHA